MKNYLLIAAFAFTAAFSLNAQAKFGYLNSQELLAGLPEIQVADTSLKTYQEQLLARGKTMMSEFEADYQTYMQEMNGGLLSKVQSTKKEEDLGVKQQEIQSYEVEVQQKLGIKREELYKPILDKLTNTIKVYGEENGFTMIFDTSAGNILHAVDSDDLTEAIKAALDKIVTAPSGD